MVTLPYYGLVLEVTEIPASARAPEESSVIVRIFDPDTGRFLREFHKSMGNPPIEARESYSRAQMVRNAVLESQQWLDDYEPKVWQQKKEEKARRRETLREARRQIWDAVGGDPMQFLMRLDDEGLSPTALSKVVPIGGARRINQILLEFGLQTRDPEGRYVPTNPSHAIVDGPYETLRWLPRGAKSLWDECEKHGLVSGGESGFLRNVQQYTWWLSL